MYWTKILRDSMVTQFTSHSFLAPDEITCPGNKPVREANIVTLSAIFVDTLLSVRYTSPNGKFYRVQLANIPSINSEQIEHLLLENHGATARSCQRYLGRAGTPLGQSFCYLRLEITSCTLFRTRTQLDCFFLILKEYLVSYSKTQSEPRTV